MGCSYRSFVSVSCCFRLRQARRKVPKRPQTNDSAHHSTPSRHVRSSNEQAPYTAANQPLDLDARLLLGLRCEQKCISEVPQGPLSPYPLPSHNLSSLPPTHATFPFLPVPPPCH